MSLEEAIETSAEILSRFRKYGISVIRVGLYPGEDLRSEGNIVAGPFHSAFGELVENGIYRNKNEAEIIKNGIRDQEYEICAPPSETSKIIGQRGCNREYFKEKYGVKLCLKPI